MSPLLYLAGPEVFRRDAVAEGERLKALCAEHGLDGIYPLDPAPGSRPAGTDPVAIRRNCIAQLERADAVLANISPFRGHHMDPGTAWEIGYAEARGLPIFLWSNDPRPMRERVPVHDNSAGHRDEDGHLIEDFDRTENIMIVPERAIVCASPEEAIKAAAARMNKLAFAQGLQRTTRRSVLLGFVIALAVALALGAVVNRLVGW